MDVGVLLLGSHETEEELFLGEEVLLREFIFAEVVGEDFDVAETPEVGLVLEGTSEEVGEVVEHLRPA